MPKQTVLIWVEGMSCANCEGRIEKKLRVTDGVLRAKASVAKGSAEITFDSARIAREEIEAAIESIGYRVSHEKPVKKGALPSGFAFLGVITLLLVGYWLLDRLGVLRLLSSFPTAAEGMGYGALFVVGLLTSLHCVAMCGGINLSQCAGGAQGDQSGSSLRASALYNLGRVISYTAVGALVGALGSVVSVTGALRGVVVITAGIFMVLMGLRMMGLFPWLARFLPRMPKRFTNGSGKKSRTPLYIGLLNGLMPCGPLQAMQLYALSTASPIKGALSMAIFSLGTVPLMFGLGAVSAVLVKRYAGRVAVVSAALVLLLGMGMLSNGLALVGTGVAPAAAPDSAQAVAAQGVDAVQVIHTKLSPRTYEPINVKKGVPVEWIIEADAKSLNGCNNAIVVPAYGIEKLLLPGENTILFTPEASGVVPFSCWMGMIKSYITVVD